MTVITKQQEFLEDLQNPTKARIRKAIRHFLQSHGESIREIHITQSIEQSCENEFTVEMIGDTYDLLLEATLIFGSAIEQFLHNPIVNRRTWIQHNIAGNAYYVTYYITEA